MFRRQKMRKLSIRMNGMHERGNACAEVLVERRTVCNVHHLCELCIYVNCEWDFMGFRPNATGDFILTETIHQMQKKEEKYDERNE